MTAKPETAAEVLAEMRHTNTMSAHNWADRLECALSAQGKSAGCIYPHEQMDALAADRYKVVPTNAGFWPFAVRAGDGEQELYKGHRSTCETVAKRLTGAFLDGGFAAAYLIAHPAPARVPSLKFTITEARKLLAFFGGNDAEVTVELHPDRIDKDRMNFGGLYAYVTDAPEEGCEYLGPVAVRDGYAAETVAPARVTEDAASFITAAHAAFKRLAAYGGACVYGVNVEAMRAKAEALTAALEDGRHG